jgi:hypothetical protein
VVSALTYHSARTLLFRAFAFRYLSDDSVEDARAEAMFPIDKLYVNCGHLHSTINTTRSVIVLDADSVISKYCCSQKDGMC